jgi:hypothetical protein
MISINGYNSMRVTGVAFLLEVEAFEKAARLQQRGVTAVVPQCSDDEKMEALWCLIRGHDRIVE